MEFLTHAPWAVFFGFVISEVLSRYRSEDRPGDEVEVVGSRIGAPQEVLEVEDVVTHGGGQSITALLELRRYAKFREGNP